MNARNTIKGAFVGGLLGASSGGIFLGTALFLRDYKFTALYYDQILGMPGRYQSCHWQEWDDGYSSGKTVACDDPNSDELISELSKSADNYCQRVAPMPSYAFLAFPIGLIGGAAIGTIMSITPPATRPAWQGNGAAEVDAEAPLSPRLAGNRAALFQPNRQDPLTVPLVAEEVNAAPPQLSPRQQSGTRSN